MAYDNKDRRRALLRTTSLGLIVAGVCLAPLSALAQTAPAPPPQVSEDTVPQTRTEAQDSEIIVTGSRIAVSGFNAPTPTTVLGEEQIAANAQPNVFTTISQLPSLQGSSGTQVNTFSTSSG
jgi:iron complex outermembrane recepter protein